MTARKKQRGNCAGCVSLALGLLMFMVGFMAYSEAQSNQEVLELSLAEWIQNPPEQTWVRLSGCQVDLAECIYEIKVNESKGEETIEEVWVPVRPSDSEEPYQLIVKGDEYQEIIGELRWAESDSDKAAVIAKHSSRFNEVTTFEGIIATIDYKIEKKFDGKVKPGDCKMLRDGGKPLEPGAIALAFFIGLALSCLGIFLIKRARQKKAQA